MKFPCRLCSYDVTITKNDRGGLDIIHTDEFGPNTGVGYIFLDFEVQILGGFEEAEQKILVEEYRNPVCQHAFGERMLSSEFSTLEGHRAPWSRETILRRIREDGWQQDDSPEHELRLEKNEEFGDVEYDIRCSCGDIWPLLGKLVPITLDEDVPLSG